MSDDWIRRRRIALAISVGLIIAGRVSTGLFTALIGVLIVGALLLPFIARGQLAGKRHAPTPGDDDPAAGSGLPAD